MPETPNVSPMSTPSTDNKASETAVTHDELVAAAIDELISEGATKPPDWLRKAFENT